MPGEAVDVHICTGPICLEDAEPGDVIVAASLGYHCAGLQAEPKPREIITIYEVFHRKATPQAF